MWIQTSARPDKTRLSRRPGAGKDGCPVPETGRRRRAKNSYRNGKSLLDFFFGTLKKNIMFSQ